MPGSDVAALRIHGLTSISDGRVQEAGGNSLFQFLFLDSLTFQVSCDGGGGALGHPRVYINLDPDGPQTCGYCGLRFVLDKDHH